MREIDFFNSDVATAFNSWVKLKSGITSLTGAVYRAFDVVIESVDNGNNWTVLNGLLGMQAGQTYDIAKEHRDSEHETLHVLTLLASWGLLEALVEDVVKTMVATEPELLQADSFAASRRRASKRGLSGDEFTEWVLDNALNNERGPLTATGGGKYEDQLALVGLTGEIPPEIAKSLVHGQQVRNVWAHRGGRADKKLIERCPDFGYEMGEEVRIKQDMLLEWIIALNLYVFILLNRFRIRNDLPPVLGYQSENNRFQADFEAMFPDAIPSDSLLSRIKSESNDPPQ